MPAAAPSLRLLIDLLLIVANPLKHSTHQQLFSFIEWCSVSVLSLLQFLWAFNVMAGGRQVDNRLEEESSQTCPVTDTRLKLLHQTSAGALGWSIIHGQSTCSGLLHILDISVWVDFWHSCSRLQNKCPERTRWKLRSFFWPRPKI